MSERRKLEEGKNWAVDASEHTLTDAEIAAITGFCFAIKIG